MQQLWVYLLGYTLILVNFCPCVAGAVSAAVRALREARCALLAGRAGVERDAATQQLVLFI
jgi:hypothetical protein